MPVAKVTVAALSLLLSVNACAVCSAAAGRQALRVLQGSLLLQRRLPSART